MFNLILRHLAQISQTFQLLLAIFLAIAHWVRQLRKEKLGLTQEQFAELLEVQPRSVQRWENGDRKPRQKYMMQMQKLERHRYYFYNQEPIAIVVMGHDGKSTLWEIPSLYRDRLRLWPRAEIG